MLCKAHQDSFTQKMERLPQLKLFCDSALRQVYQALEDEESIPSEALVRIRNVLNETDLRSVEQERFAQSKCASLVCSHAVDKNAAADRSNLIFEASEGTLVDGTERVNQFCSKECFKKGLAFSQGLDLTPVYLRADPVSKVLAAALALGFSKTKLDSIRKEAGELMPPTLKIREEAKLKDARPPTQPENTASASAAESHEFDVRELMEWFEDDKGDTTVGVPLIPLVWDVLGQYATSETRQFVIDGCQTPEGCVLESPEQEVSNLQGRSISQRRARFSQAVGVQMRSLLEECEMDPSDARHLMGRTDHLINTMFVGHENTMLKPGASLSYQNPSDLFFTSKSLRIVAAVFVGVVQPKDFARVAKEVRPKVQAHEWELLLSIFRE